CVEMDVGFGGTHKRHLVAPLFARNPPAAGGLKRCSLSALLGTACRVVLELASYFVGRVRCSYDSRPADEVRDRRGTDGDTSVAQKDNSQPGVDDEEGAVGDLLFDRGTSTKRVRP